MVDAALKANINGHFLNRYSMTLPDDWLNQCIEFLIEEYPNHSPNQFKDLIYSQLLDFDLVEIQTHCLPPQIFSNPTGTISGRFFLQVVLCIDISQPYYAQLQKLQGLINENALVDADNVPNMTQFERNAGSKNRLLMLILTDGDKLVKAMEHSPIRTLSDDILPGTKVELHGNIEFRNQVLFLSSDKISILGGNVENLSTPDHFVKAIEEELEEKRSCNSSVHDRERVANFDSGEVKMSKPSQNAKMMAPMNSQKSQVLSHVGNNMNQQRVKSELASQKVPNQNFKEEQRSFSYAGAAEDDDDDDLLSKCDFDSFDKKPQQKANSFKMGGNNNNNNNTVNQLKSTAEIYHNFKVNNQPSGNIKRPPSTDCLSSISESYNRSSNQAAKGQSSLMNNKKPKIDEMAIDDDEDDYESDFKAIKAATSVDSALSTGSFKSASSKSSSLDRIEANQLAPEPSRQSKAVPNQTGQQKQQAPPKPSTNPPPSKKPAVEEEEVTSAPVDIQTLMELPESCCMFNVSDEPNAIGSSVATCEHEVRCQVKTLTAQLKQIKLNWHQECILADETADSLSAYISDGPMSELLEMTCAQAKELFVKSRQQSQMAATFPQAKPAEDYNTIFTRRRKNCEEVLKSNMFLMRVKYDFNKSSYCVVKLTRV